MGGIIAIGVALARPNPITHLILAATSGGMDITGLGGQDWPSFVRSDYSAPDWFIDYHEDFTERLHELEMPVLLLWGDSDPISPVAVGESSLCSCPELIYASLKTLITVWAARTLNRLRHALISIVDRLDFKNLRF